MRNPQIQEVLSALGVQMDELAKRLGWSYELMVGYGTTSKEVPDEVIDTIARELNVSSSAFTNDGYKDLFKQ